MPQYDTPGVYFERPDNSARGIDTLRMDVAAFVGIARHGPLHTPLPVESWRQFQALFGGFIGSGYLAYVAHAFFENGGRRCWCVRVASDAACAAVLTLPDSSGALWEVTAASPGVWGNDLQLHVSETRRTQTRSRPQGTQANYAEVGSVAGFVRGSLVELRQGGVVAYRVLSEVDAIRSRLVWCHEDPMARLPYDLPLQGMNTAQPILIESIAYTLALYDNGRLVKVYPDLALIPEHPRYGPALLAAPQYDLQSLQRNRLPQAPEPIVVTALRTPGHVGGISRLLLADSSHPEQRYARSLIGGADGLATLRVFDFVGAKPDPLDDDTAQAAKRRGLAALENIGEIGVVALPDIHIQPRALPQIVPPPVCIPDPCLPAPPPEPARTTVRSMGDLPPVFDDEAVFHAQAALIDHCERHRDRIALIDPPYSTVKDIKLGSSAIRMWRARFDSSYAALYYPWLVVVDPLRYLRMPTLWIPPCGHVAGQYAATDSRSGVHKAPANHALSWAQDATQPLDDAVHGILNPVGINAIRVLDGRGLRIYGARTLSSDSNWAFVNVRRLLIMIEKAIGLALQWVVFEPNHLQTRTKLYLVLSSFLRQLWQRGALMGASPDEAFFVRCDDGNNPPSMRERGELLAEVGVAPSVPFEFVVLRIGRHSNGLEIAAADSLPLVGA